MDVLCRDCNHFFTKVDRDKFQTLATNSSNSTNRNTRRMYGVTLCIRKVESDKFSILATNSSNSTNRNTRLYGITLCMFNVENALTTKPKYRMTNSQTLQPIHQTLPIEKLDYIWDGLTLDIQISSVEDASTTKPT